MIPSDPVWPLIATLCLLLGVLLGLGEARHDDEVLDEREWNEHVQRALWVARR